MTRTPASAQHFPLVYLVVGLWLLSAPMDPRDKLGGPATLLRPVQGERSGKRDPDPHGQCSGGDGTLARCSCHSYVCRISHRLTTATGERLEGEKMPGLLQSGRGRSLLGCCEAAGELGLEHRRPDLFHVEFTL